MSNEYRVTDELSKFVRNVRELTVALNHLARNSGIEFDLHAVSELRH